MEQQRTSYSSEHKQWNSGLVIMKYLHKLDNKELTLSVFMTRSWDNSDSFFFKQSFQLYLVQIFKPKYQLLWI